MTTDSRSAQFNAWTSQWLPLQQSDGSTRWASPVEVLSGEQDGIDLEYPRDDFRVYARLLLSALVQALFPAKDSAELQYRLEVPLTRAEVEARILPVLADFDLFGPTPFLQVVRPAVAPEKGAASFVFVMEDLFRAPAPVDAISLPIALLSTFIEQTYAGGAGRGYGAGPAGQPGAFTLLNPGSIRRGAWANSLNLELAARIYARDDDRPWSNGKREPAQRSSIGLVGGLFFQPRAMWLEPAGFGSCSFSGMTGPLVRRSPILPKSELPKKQPGSEDLWRHPCAPLALNAQGIGAVRLSAERPIWTWLAQLLRPLPQTGLRGKKSHPAEGPALVLRQWRELNRLNGSVQLIILDFERDKANVKGRFFESVLVNDWLLANEDAIERLRTVNEDAVNVLRALMKALARAHGERKSKGTALADARVAFWHESDLLFFGWLDVMNCTQDWDPANARLAAAEQAFRTAIRATALRLFDAHAALSEFDSRKQRAVAMARRQLTGVLRGAAAEPRSANQRGDIMSEANIGKVQRSESLQEEIREVRRRYDQLSRAARAALRCCRTADDVALEDSYWKIGGALANDDLRLRHLVLLFPEASHATQERFSFGRFLRRELSENRSIALRFRRVLESRDRRDLCERLRGLLRRATNLGAPVDWGVLGADIVCFFNEDGHVRRRWAQDFYAPFSTWAGNTQARPVFDSEDSHDHLR